MNNKLKNTLIVLAGMVLLFFSISLLKSKKENKQLINDEIKLLHENKNDILEMADEAMETFEEMEHENDSLKELAKNKKTKTKYIIKKIQNSPKDSVIYQIKTKDSTIYNTVTETILIVDTNIVYDTIKIKIESEKDKKLKLFNKK
jgi:cell division FtsZ-interacting protein ZapD